MQVEISSNELGAGKLFSEGSRQKKGNLNWK